MVLISRYAYRKLLRESDVPMRLASFFGYNILRDQDRFYLVRRYLYKGAPCVGAHSPMRLIQAFGGNGLLPALYGLYHGNLSTLARASGGGVGYVRVCVLLVNSS